MSHLRKPHTDWELIGSRGSTNVVFQASVRANRDVHLANNHLQA
jgi:hypothetical protein